MSIIGSAARVTWAAGVSQPDQILQGSAIEGTIAKSAHSFGEMLAPFPVPLRAIVENARRNADLSRDISHYLDRERFALFNGAPRVAHQAKREGVTEPARVQALSHDTVKIVFAQRVMPDDLPVIDGRASRADHASLLNSCRLAMPHLPDKGRLRRGLCCPSLDLCRSAGFCPATFLTTGKRTG